MKAERVLELARDASYDCVRRIDDRSRYTSNQNKAHDIEPIISDVIRKVIAELELKHKTELEREHKTARWLEWARERGLE